jgi:hypothetical protein
MVAAAAGVLRPINPDIILLQEVRDYEACVRLGEAIAPGMYHVAICSAFKEPFQRGLGKQQVAILAKYQAKAAWGGTLEIHNIPDFTTEAPVFCPCSD